MNHVAILEPKYIKKTLDKEKTIESRWSNDKRSPYKKVYVNDIIYLKESGGKVLARAKAGKCLFFDNLDSRKNLRLFKKFNSKIKADKLYFNKIKNRSYCSLVFLKTVSKITPFDIKRSYGNAWISIKDIDEIKRP